MLHNTWDSLPHYAGPTSRQMMELLLELLLLELELELLLAETTAETQ